jgi:signal transduction histidine kinase
LIKDKDGISVTIEDNGKGFIYDPAKVTEGIGLNNIHSRIQFLKGSIDIDSSPGKGTLIAIHLPTPNNL